MKAFLLLFLLCISSFSFSQGNSTKKSPSKRHAMVVSAHPLASKAGYQVMREGGNAWDAAVAVQFALAVCLPAAGNIGGGGFLVGRQANGVDFTIDYRERAPQQAHERMYLDASGKPIDSLSKEGVLAAGIPGTVFGMAELHKAKGRLPWKRLLAPAIQMAEKGVLLTEKEAKLLEEHRVVFQRNNPEGCAFICPRTEGWKKGDVLVQKELAETLKGIAKQGSYYFYQGRGAQTLLNFMQLRAGNFQAEDLKEYKSVNRPAVHCSFRDIDIISMPPPSSGGIGLCYILGEIEHYLDKGVEFGNPAYVHLLAEAERRYYIDRSRYLGDPDFHSIPVEALLNKQYIESRMETYREDQASPTSSLSTGNIPGYESLETTHFSVVDYQGNAASVTTTLNGAYGSHVVVKGGGYLLNNEMDDFSVHPGQPNSYGLIGGKANAIAPGKRMLSSMSPMIAVQSGKLLMVNGSPGGSTIITSVLQTFLNSAVWGMNMQESVNQKRFHHQAWPDEIKFEKGCFSADLMEKLKKMGHTLKEVNSIGRVDAIWVMPDGSLVGGADPRGDDAISGD